MTISPDDHGETLAREAIATEEAVGFVKAMSAALDPESKYTDPIGRDAGWFEHRLKTTTTVLGDLAGPLRVRQARRDRREQLDEQKRRDDRDSLPRSA